MKVAVFSAKPYDVETLARENSAHGHQLTFLEARLTPQTAHLAWGYDAVCTFVNDQLSRSVLTTLAQGGTQLIALRCAGYDNVDLEAADELGLTVTRVPAYSPHAVAEHAVALMLAMNRKLTQARDRVHRGDFRLNGLLGFDFHQRTVGIVGTGKIGQILARIMHGFGCRILAHDPIPNLEVQRLGGVYVSLSTIYQESDIISLHCPLTPASRHLINAQAISQMKPGVMLVNTGRGALLDTRAALEGLESGQLGSLGLDVYEHEAALFFEDHSREGIQDSLFLSLLAHPRALVTGHQAFFTEEALDGIARTVLNNVSIFAQGCQCENVVRLSRAA